MVDSNRNCAGTKNLRQESGSSASSYSFLFECKCQSQEAIKELNQGIRTDCPGHSALNFCSTRRLVGWATLVVLFVLLCGFVGGFAVFIECSMSISEVDMKINQMRNEIQRLKEALTELKMQQNYQANDLFLTNQLTLQHQQQQLSRTKRDDEDENRKENASLGERKKRDGSRPRRHKRPNKKENLGKKSSCKKDLPAFHVTMSELKRRNDEPTLERAEDGIHSPQKYIYGSWTVAVKSSRDYDLVRGNSIRVKSQGLYFVYSQILFHSAAAISAYRIYANATELARCITSVDHVKQNSAQAAENARYKTCYTGIIVFLETGELLQLRSDYNYTVSRQTNSNFFGLFRISA